MPQYLIKNIKNKIKENAMVFYFLINKNKEVLVAKGKNKKESKEVLQEKICKKPDKYIGSRLWRISIKLYDGTERGLQIFGDVVIMLENYTVTDGLKIKKKAELYKTGQIWFTKKWLEYHDWDRLYMVNIIKRLLSDNVKIKLTGPNMYNDKFM